MKKNILLFVVITCSIIPCTHAQVQNTKIKTAPVTITVFNQVLFYDGYAAVVTTPPPPANVIRHRNDLYATKLTDAQLQLFGNTLKMNVTVKAACDNYDRIGGVNLAFVTKGASTYDPASVKRIEIARFITPFMDKNKTPNQVPYSYTINDVSGIFRDKNITSVYDIWVELEIFGVPYAANTQITGCAGRTDVFYGSLDFITDTDPNIPVFNSNLLLPLSLRFDLNNYKAGSTDVLGQTVKTINFNLSANASNVNLYLITSNHGANSGGEEYNRRNHYIYIDNVLKLTYKPGGLSCEPFRVYNTQANGIYGSAPMSAAQWASFSNWCPGDVIPIRVLKLGSMSSGAHSFKIDVPDAKFVGQQGTIPVSLYMQAESQLVNMNELDEVSFSLFPSPTNGFFTIQSDKAIKDVTILDMLGQQIRKEVSNRVDLSAAEKGIYLVQIRFQNNRIVTRKIVKE